MSIQRIQPSKRFSEVVIHNNTAYFAGQVPEKTVKQNAYEQTKEVLSLIDKLCQKLVLKKQNPYHANLPCRYGRLCST